MKKVETRREKIYQYIVERVSAGLVPTVREICEDVGIPSTSTVHTDLKHLIEAGLIEMTNGRNRTIRLPGGQSVRVPLLGTVAAGEPILAVQNIEQYIPVNFAGAGSKELFALRVKGDSMIKAAILDGDLVVVERQPAVDNGQIAVVMLEDEATVKRIYKENGGFRLQPENDNMQPVLVPQAEILGRVLSVIRYYD